MEERLAKGEMDTEIELLVLPEEHEVQLNESLYFTYKSWNTKKEKQWWCCFACLDWPVEEIASEWLEDVSKVQSFIEKMYRVRKKYIKDNIIPITKAPRSLTIHEVLPDTPKKQARGVKDKELINNIAKMLVNSN